MPWCYNRRSHPARGLGRRALMLLASLAIFCHGCHGDEDTELFCKNGTALLRARHRASAVAACSESWDSHRHGPGEQIHIRIGERRVVVRDLQVVM